MTPEDILRDAFVQIAKMGGQSTDSPDRSDRSHRLIPYLVDWPQLWADEHDAEQWLLRPLFATGRGHAVFAGAKTGKSFVVLAAVAALAAGKPFLGHKGGDPVHVLYLDYEMTADDLRDRLVEFGYGPDDDLSHLHYALLPSLPGLDTPEGGAALMEAVRALGVQLVVIDTTSRSLDFASGRDESSAKPYQDFYRWTGLHLKSEGIAWVRLDHAGKDAEKGQRGSSAKNDDVDVVWKLSRREGGVTLHATHRRMGWVPEKVEVTIAETPDGSTTFKEFGGAGWPLGTKECADTLNRLGVPVDVGRPTARLALKAAGEKATNVALAAAIRWRKEDPHLWISAPDTVRKSLGHSPIRTIDGQSEDNDETMPVTSTDSATDSDGQFGSPLHGQSPPYKGGQSGGTGPEDPPKNDGEDIF